MRHTSTPPYTSVVEIESPDPDCRAPLYEPRDGEQSYPSFLWIDTRDHTAGWDFTYALNGGPPEYWNGFLQRIPCSSRLTGAQLVKLSVQLSPMVDRVCAGAGSTRQHTNRVATFTADAERALIEIEMILENVEDGIADVWGAEDYLLDVTRIPLEVEDEVDWDPEILGAVQVTPDLTITADTSDKELMDASQALEAEAWAEGSLLVLGLYDYLAELRDECAR